MKEKLLNSYLYVFDNEPYKITTEANGIYIQEEFVKEFAHINPSLVNKMIPINYYVIKANNPEWYSYMVSTETQPAPLGPDSSLPDNPELVVDGDNITVSEYGNDFKLFDNPNNIEGVIYNSTNENVAYFSNEQEGEVKIAGPGTTVLSQEFAGDDEYLPFSKSYNLEVEDITVDPEIAWSQNSATVQIGESNSFPTISNPHNVGLRFSSSDENVATVNQETGEVSLVAAGNCTISCTSIQDADYYSSTVEYSLTILAAKVNPNLSWSFSPATVQMGETNLFPSLQNGDNVSPIVYSSSNQAVATVDPNTGAVSLVSAGSCYITASFAGNSQYNAYTISYELTVLAASVLRGYSLTKTLPTAQNLDEYINLNASKPSAESIDMTDLTGPTEFYLIYPVAWEVIENDFIEKPVIIDDTNGGDVGIWFEGQDPKITVSGKDYRIANVELGKGTFTIEF